MINDAEVELKTSMVASQEKGGGRRRGRKTEREREARRDEERAAFLANSASYKSDVIGST